MNLGAKVKYLREQMCISQEDLAYFLDTDADWVARFESCVPDISVSAVMLHKLSGLFCVPESVLLSDTFVTHQIDSSLRMSAADLSVLYTIHRVALNASYMSDVLVSV